MPRGKRRTIEDRIAELDEQIAVKEAAVKELKSQRAMLVKEKEEKGLEELYQIIAESGKTLDEVRELLG